MQRGRLPGSQLQVLEGAFLNVAKTASGSDVLGVLVVYYCMLRLAFWRSNPRVPHFYMSHLQVQFTKYLNHLDSVLVANCVILLGWGVHSMPVDV